MEPSTPRGLVFMDPGLELSGSPSLSPLDSVPCPGHRMRAARLHMLLTAGPSGEVSIVSLASASGPSLLRTRGSTPTSRCKNKSTDTVFVLRTQCTLFSAHAAGAEQ